MATTVSSKACIILLMCVIHINGLAADPGTEFSITTPRSSVPLVYNFENATHGWILSNNNDNRWALIDATDLVPSGYSRVLAVQNGNYYAGPTIAKSPVFRSTETDARLDITFWLRGSIEVPTQLKIYKEIQEYYRPKRTLISDLGAFGLNPATAYLTLSIPVPVTEADDVFQIVLEGYTGQTKGNIIVVPQIVISGLEEVVMNNNNLTIWQSGHTLGSSWYTEDIMDQTGIHVDWGMNPRSAHPGMATLESPLLAPELFYREKVGLEFWLAGSESYPAELTLRRRDADGLYDDKPFLDLRPYGTIRNLGWEWIESTLLPRSSKPFQIIVEGCLGSSSNFVRIRNLTVTTHDNQENILKAVQLL